MKKSLVILFLMPLLLGSCGLLDGDFPLYYDMYGVGIVREDGMIYSNSGSTALTVAEDNTDGKWTECKKIFYRCDLLTDKKAESDVVVYNQFFGIRLKSYIPVTIKASVDLADTTPEEIGSDGIMFYQDWGYDPSSRTLDMAVNYSAKKESATAHDINLVFDRARSSKDSLFFHLRHNGHGEVYENEDMGVQDVEIRTSYYSFDISQAIPQNPGEKTAVAIEWDWYKSEDGAILTRQTEPSMVLGNLYFQASTQSANNTQ